MLADSTWGHGTLMMNAGIEIQPEAEEFGSQGRDEISRVSEPTPWVGTGKTAHPEGGKSSNTKDLGVTSAEVADEASQSQGFGEPGNASAPIYSLDGIGALAPNLDGGLKNQNTPAESAAGRDSLDLGFIFPSLRDSGTPDARAIGDNGSIGDDFVSNESTIDFEGLQFSIDDISISTNTQQFGKDPAALFYDYMDFSVDTDQDGVADRSFRLKGDFSDGEFRVINSETGTTLVFFKDVAGTSGSLIGTAGRDKVQGTDGDDILIGNGMGDILIGGGGMDAASYETSSTGILVDLSATYRNDGDAEGDSYLSIENLIGTDFADELIGDAQDNRIEGRAGDDTILGGLGSDTLIGGTGNDIFGLFQSAVGDTDVFDGGAGHDEADFGGFTSAVWVDLGFNGVEAWTKDEPSATGDGDWREIADLISIENLVGTDFDDVLIGNDEVNRLQGGLGSDSLSGGGGNDVFKLSESAAGDLDVFDGGSGHDEADFTGFTSAVWVDLGFDGVDVWTKDDPTATGEGDWREIADLISIENLVGTMFDDRLIGNDDSNRFQGGFGSDQISGAGGDDVFKLSHSADGDLDVFDGGADQDTVDFTGFTAAVWVDLGFSDVEVWTKDDTIATGDGDWREIADLMSIENLVGSIFDDRLIGNDEANRIVGGLGNDELTGLGGADVFEFTFVSEDADQNDIITDLVLGEDVLLVNGLSAEEFFGDSLFDSMEDGGGIDTTITLSTGDTLVLQGLTVAEIEAFFGLA